MEHLGDEFLAHIRAVGVRSVDEADAELDAPALGPTQRGMRSGHNFKNLSTDSPLGGYAETTEPVSLGELR